MPHQGYWQGQQCAVLPTSFDPVCNFTFYHVSTSYCVLRTAGAASNSLPTIDCPVRTQNTSSYAVRLSERH